MTTRVSSLSWLVNDSGTLVGYVDKAGVERNMDGTQLTPGASPATPSLGNAPRLIASQSGAAAAVNTATITTTTYPTQLQTVSIPAGTLVQPGAVLEIDVSMTCTSSANTKSLWLLLGGIQVGPTLAPTTSLSATGRVRIRCVSPTSQIVDVLTTDGASGTTLATTAINMTTDQQLIIMGQLGGSFPSSDSIALKSYMVMLMPPPTPLPVSAAPAIVPLTPGIKTFYGVNSHPGYYPTVTGAQHAQVMQNLGMTVLRLDYNGSSNNAAFQNIATAFAGKGLQICACIPCSMDSTPGTAYASESAAYNGNFALGQAAALALGPMGVRIFGCGNELDAHSAGGTQIRTPSINVLGTVPVDFVSSVWPLFRGAIKGCIDGVKSVMPNALCTSNAFTLSSIWAADALWNGVGPSGDTGNAQVRWDITDFHAYTLGLGTSNPYSGGGGQPTFNMLQYLSSAYGRPIFISEYNPNIGGVTDSSSTASTTTTWLTAWYQNQAQYNIAGVFFYDLFDSPYQLINSDVAPFTLNQTGTAIKNFIAANPALR